MKNTPHIVFMDAGSMGNDFLWPDFSNLGRVTIHQQTEKADVLKRIQEADIVLTNKVYISEAHINAAPNLRFIGTVATGFNQVDGAAAAKRGIPLCNVPDYSTPAVAQHVFALLLELCAGLCQHIQSVRDGEWIRCSQFCYWKKSITELAGKTMGIVGFGNTGQAVGRIANSFGMKVLAYAPRPKAAPDYAPFAFVDLSDLLKQSDVISLHCPLTSENEGMVNTASLRTMKKNALLINCSRGPLVNENDLLEALQQGIIAGAGLDVVAHEPMRENNPLRFAPNCVITPHIAWASVESRTRLMQGVYDNIKNFLDGTPTNVQNGM